MDHRRRRRRQRHEQRRARGTPRWFDHENTKECDHDIEEHPPENIRQGSGFSDSAFWRARCGHPECEETWDGWLEG